MQDTQKSANQKIWYYQTEVLPLKAKLILMPNNFVSCKLLATETAFSWQFSDCTLDGKIAGAWLIADLDSAAGTSCLLVFQSGISEEMTEAPTAT